MNTESYSMSLRLRHPTESVESLVLDIGVSPIILQSLGEQRQTLSGTLLEGVYEQSYCNYNLARRKPGYFVDELEQWIVRLEDFRDIFSKIKRENGRIDIYVGVFVESTGGFMLSSKAMISLGSLGIDLDVEYYAG